MENKKTYVAPEMKVVELDYSTTLLADSMGIEFINRD
jgi:hypothetical protein